MQAKKQKVYFHCHFACIWAALSECSFEDEGALKGQQKMHICTHMRIKIVNYCLANYFCLMAEHDADI